MSKIQVLQHDVNNTVLMKNVYTELAANKVQLAKFKTLLLTEVYSDDYSASIKSVPPDMAIIDFRHWLYPDDVFDKYIRRIASFELPYVCLGESPFEFERPCVDLSSFEEKLYKRTKIASDLLRSLSPKTKIVSPAIGIIDPEFQENYLNFFIHNRKCFDIYSAHCIYDLEEQTLGLLTSFINQVLQTLRKPVWVTQWSVPSCEHKISNQSSLTPLDWIPKSHHEAAMQLSRGFREIEEVAGNNTKWFFSGMNRDCYVPTGKMPSFWDGYEYRAYMPGTSSWSYKHFLGCLTYKDELKTEIFNAVMDLAREHG